MTYETADRATRPSGFDDFYCREYPGAVRLAYVLTCSPELAEDLVQEAFARLHPRYGQLDNPGGYLRVTVVNLAREAHRRRASEARRLLRLTPPVVTQAPAGSELLDILRRLPERQRTVLVLRYWADWTEADIAKVLGCRRGTVKSIASRGLAAMRSEIQQ